MCVFNYIFLVELFSAVENFRGASANPSHPFVHACLIAFTVDLLSHVRVHLCWYATKEIHTAFRHRLLFGKQMGRETPNRLTWIRIFPKGKSCDWLVGKVFSFSTYKYLRRIIDKISRRWHANTHCIRCPAIKA